MYCVFLVPQDAPCNFKVYADQEKQSKTDTIEASTLNPFDTRARTACKCVVQDAPCDFKVYADQQKQSRTDTTTNPSYKAPAAAGTAWGGAGDSYGPPAAGPAAAGGYNAPFQDQQQQQFGGGGGDAAVPMCGCGEPAAIKTSRCVCMTKLC